MSLMNIIPSVAGPVEAWKSLTLAGNRAFSEGDLDVALFRYRVAQGCIIEIFPEWPHIDEATAALVVSYFNLAQTHVKLGRTDKAAERLAAIHTYLIRVAAERSICACLRMIFVRHMRETYAALTRFQAEFGAFDAVQGALDLTDDAFVALDFSTTPTRH